jgi:hypothetical protein
MTEQLKDKKVYLVFGAVDESCWVYVNGKAAGTHLYKKQNDWSSPFTMRIDQYLSGNGDQTIVVKVEDKSGQGGIWKPVWVAIGKDSGESK